MITQEALLLRICGLISVSFLFKFEKPVLENVENIKIQIYNIINSL